MRTPPPDLPESMLRAALADGWSLTAATLEYRAVGFGSHHWELTVTDGTRRFVTVDDLRTRRRSAGEPLTIAYDRLRAALSAAVALHAALAVPVAQPTARTTPVTQPTALTTPVTQPTAPTTAVTQPTALTTAVTQPTARTAPVALPAALAPPVAQHTAPTAPVTQPTSPTAPLAPPTAGRDFVVAPLPTRTGEPLAMLGDYFAVAVYPFVAGESFDWETATPQHRRVVLDLLVAVHSAPLQVAELAPVDDYAIQLRETLESDDTGDPDLGPYARPAADLLTTHASGVRDALSRFDALVTAARTDPPALVLTHGEPHPGNTMRTDNGWLLIDWDTALLAPPERDLWDLVDDGVTAAYAAATGTVVRAELLELYRLRWDLTEIALGLAHFRKPHGTTADDQETWTNLQESITNITPP